MEKSFIVLAGRVKKKKGNGRWIEKERTRRAANKKCQGKKTTIPALDYFTSFAMTRTYRNVIASKAKQSNDDPFAS
jgi:hypothetical protein